MARVRWIGALIAVLATGCMPSTEVKSAGQVGCSPDEITISNDETHFGLIQSGETWLAECHGRRFVCSQLNQSGDDQSILDHVLASEQVSCREEAESPEATTKRRDAEAAALSAHVAPVLPPAPNGAAGFEFGQSLGDAAQRCSAVGERWTGSGERYACSGPAVSIGMTATIGFVFCGGRICSIAVQHVPNADFNQRAVFLKQNLEAKYGPVQESRGTVPEQCRAREAFDRCAEAKQVVLEYTWRWSGGESIELSVGKPNESEPAAIRLVYRRPAHALDMSAL